MPTLQEKLALENKYLFDNEQLWFQKVFKLDARYAESCNGLVSAHADKCEQYREYWEQRRIPQHRGILMYLLTYTKLMEETPKQFSKEWVVVNYHKYQSIFMDLELS